MILPLSLVHQEAIQKKLKSMEAYNEDQMIRKLTRDMFPESPYYQIRQELIREGKFCKPQNANEVRLLKLYTKHHRYRKMLSAKLAKDSMRFSDNKFSKYLSTNKEDDSDEI